MLDQYECLHRMSSQAMHHMFREPVNAAPRKSIASCRPLKVVGADIFMINGKTVLCIVDHHNKCPIVKNINKLSADNLMQMAKLILAEYRIPKKIVSEMGTNSMANTSKPLAGG